MRIAAPNALCMNIWLAEAVENSGAHCNYLVRNVRTLTLLLRSSHMLVNSSRVRRPFQKLQLTRLLLCYQHVPNRWGEPPCFHSFLANDTNLPSSRQRHLDHPLPWKAISIREHLMHPQHPVPPRKCSRCCGIFSVALATVAHAAYTRGTREHGGGNLVLGEYAIQYRG
jgi:hypothetical protein